MRALLLLVFACHASKAPVTQAWTGDEPVKSQPRDCIEQFIADAGLPNVYSVDIVAKLESGAAVFFQVDYGKANDCPSGCFTSHALGVLRTCDRIGWLTVDDYDHVDSLRRHAYRPDPDDLLLSPETDAELLRTTQWFHDGGWARWLARVRPRTPGP